MPKKHDVSDQNNPRINKGDDLYDVSAKDFLIAQFVGRIAGTVMGGLVGLASGMAAGSPLYAVVGMALGGGLGNVLGYKVATYGKSPSSVNNKKESVSETYSDSDETSHGRMSALSRNVSANDEGVIDTIDNRAHQTLNLRRKLASDDKSATSEQASLKA